MPIHQNSRYRNGTVYHHLDKEKGLVKLLTRSRPLQIPEDGKVIQHQFKQGETVYNLAEEYFGDAHLWWVILDCNPEYFAPWEIEIGDVLIIPTQDTLMRMRRG